MQCYVVLLKCVGRRTVKEWHSGKGHLRTESAPCPTGLRDFFDRRDAVYNVSISPFSLSVLFGILN